MMFSDINAAVMGSINMDFILNMEKVPEAGENLLGTDYGYSSGGKGANQAIAVSRLGAKCRMIGKLANDNNGKALLANLKKNNVDISGIDMSGTQTGLATIMIDGEGKNRIVVFEGANAEIDADEACKFITKDLDLLLVQFETRAEVVIKTVNKAISLGITTVVDCGPSKKFPLEKMQGVTILTPNEFETKTLTGIYPESDEEILKASKVLADKSKAKFVVLKLGARGCSVWDGKELLVLPAKKSCVVDTTAAGDSFTAAMALEYKRSGNIYSACVLGNKAGAIAVSRMGADASMPTLDELSENK